MKRLFSVLATAAVAAALTLPASATMMSGHPMASTMKCPRGMHFVKAYTTKSGKFVKAHCSH